MKTRLKTVGYAAAMLLGMGAMPTAYAVDTLVQFDSGGGGDGSDGSYDTVAINEFDWQSSGDLVVEQIISDCT